MRLNLAFRDQFNKQFEFQKMDLKNIFKNKPPLYKIWFYSFRKWTGDKVRLPEVNDHLYTDGYPRSGNTYLCGLLGFAHKELTYTSHLHVTASIKMALKMNIPVFVLMRLPEDAVVSNMYNKVQKKSINPDQKLADELLIQYINYYSFVEMNTDKLSVILFESAINDKPGFLEKLTKRINQSNSSTYREIIQSFDRRMREKEKVKITATSALPNDKRKEFKKSNIQLVTGSEFYNEAERIYQNLAEKALI